MKKLAKEDALCSEAQRKHLLSVVYDVERSGLKNRDVEKLPEYKQLEKQVEELKAKIQIMHQKMDVISEKHNRVVTQLSKQKERDCREARTSCYFKASSEALKAVEALRTKYGQYLD